MTSAGPITCTGGWAELVEAKEESKKFVASHSGSHLIPSRFLLAGARFNRGYAITFYFFRILVTKKIINAITSMVKNMPTPMPVLNIPPITAQPGNRSIAISKRLIMLWLPGRMFFILLYFKS